MTHQWSDNPQQTTLFIRRSVRAVDGKHSDGESVRPTKNIQITYYTGLIFGGVN